MRVKSFVVIAALSMLMLGGSPALFEDRTQAEDSLVAQHIAQENVLIQINEEIQAQAEDPLVSQVVHEQENIQNDPQQAVSVQIRMEGSPTFQQAMQGNIQMLANNEALARWVGWASDNGVVIREDPALLREAGAQPWANAVVFRSGGQGAIEAAMLVEEIQHLMDDAGLPAGETCSKDPWSHERVLKARLLAARLLGAPASYIDDMVWTQFKYALSADALRAEGLHEPCQDFKSP